jgi:hypothetical protein
MRVRTVLTIKGQYLEISSSFYVEVSEQEQSPGSVYPCVQTSKDFSTYMYRTACTTSTYRDRVEIGAYTTTLYVMEDIVK